MNLDPLLVSTKFAPPHVGSRFIPRKHLLQQLNDGQRGTVVLVTGGAGFGKTILLAQWRREVLKAGGEVSWLSLSHEEKDLGSFCTYLQAALERLGLPIEDELLLDRDIGQSIDAMVATVVNAAASIPKELYLIIDDYHHVDDQRAHKLVQKLIDHGPGNLHIAIASRASPPLSISRLRVRGRVTEIGFNELPFGLEESRNFLGLKMGAVKLNADEVRLIHDKTGGWPASLELMAIMLRSRPETRSTLNWLNLSSAHLQAYLAEDVVAHLPAELIEFMEKMSICRRFNAELAAAVTRNADAAGMIQQAEEQNLLIYRVESDDRSPWYRLHPLFGEFLAARLSRRGEPASDLHRRASQWFAAQDFLVEAVRHATLGDDLGFAVAAIEHAAPETWSLSHIGLMLNLLDRLPQETLFANSRLFLLGCMTFAFAARPAKAEQWLAQIRQSDAAKNPAISSKLPLLEAAVALQRDDMQRVIDLLEPLGDVAPQKGFLHYAYLAILSAAFASAGRYADARKLHDDHPLEPDELRNDMAEVAEGALLLALVAEGKVREAVRFGAPRWTRAEAVHGRTSRCGNLTAATLSDCYYELDRIEDARELLANRTGILRASMPQIMLSAALAHARLDALQESPDAALSFLQAQADHYRSAGLDRLVAHMLVEQVRIQLHKGEREHALALVADLDEIESRHRDAEIGHAEISAIAALGRARVWLVNHAPKEALKALSVVRDYAHRYGRGRLLVLADVLAAFALDDLGQDSECTARLFEALQSGHRFGLVRTFLDEGRRAGELLARLRSDPRLSPSMGLYLDDLFGRYENLRPPMQGKRAPGEDEHVSLTPRELDILGLVSQCMSNKRIALTLNISIDTVKWNLRNILGKLRLSSRYDAMNWARKRGLIK